LKEGLKIPLFRNFLCAIVLAMAQEKKKCKELLSKVEYEILLAFHDIAKDLFEGSLQKIILFGRKKKPTSIGTLDVLLLFSSFSKADQKEVSQIAEELSENTLVQISPIAMDNKTYQSYKKEKHPLIQDIETTGCDFS